MPYVLQTDRLSKEIGGRALVKDIDIHIPKGSIYGFLGPNGAGKTTVMKLITNLWKPTAGTIELFGEPLTPTSYSVLGRMGSVIEFPTFYDHLSGRENLRLHADYMGYHAPGCVDHALELLELAPAADRQVRRYSLGMRQRLGIARAILSKPELLILDEPTNGLDPAGIKQIRDLLKMLSREYGITVMVSSHILSEIEHMADRVGIICQGSMMQELALGDIQARDLAYIQLTVADPRRAAAVLAGTLGLENFKVMDGGEIRVYDQEASPQAISKALALQGVELSAVGRHSETLEDYFLKLTGEVAQ